MLRTVLLLLSAFCGLSLAAQMDEVFAWNELQYVWPDEATRQHALVNQAYIPNNNLPLGLERWGSKLFITVPRWKAGVASALNYVVLSNATRSPPLYPYPSMQSNTLPEEGGQVADDAVVSTFRVRADQCDRLWVMDTGVDQLLGAHKQIAKPALVIFDLNTDKLIKRFTFPDDVVRPNSFLVNVAVDITDNCDDAYAYVSDISGFAIIVYSLKTNKSWRVEHHYFYFDPLSGDYNIAGVNFQWADGVFGLALSEIRQSGFRDLFFHAISSNNEFVVSTGVLRNETLAKDPKSYHAYQLLGTRGDKAQSASSFYDEKTGVLFFTQISRDGISCWNAQKPFTQQNIPLIVEDKETLIYPNDIKVDRDRNVWVLSDRLPLFWYKALDLTQENYRILRGTVEYLISNSTCAK